MLIQRIEWPRLNFAEMHLMLHSITVLGKTAPHESTPGKLSFEWSHTHKHFIHRRKSLNHNVRSILDFTSWERKDGFNVNYNVFDLVTK